LNAKEQIGDYTFHFADEATMKRLRPALSVLVESPEKLEDFEPLQSKKGKTAHVFRFRVAGTTYVGKWARADHVLDRARNLVRVPKAKRARDNSMRLRALGFDTPSPVAYGVRRKAGLVRRSILITEELSGVWKLHQFLYQFCGAPESREIRRSLMRLLGQTVARLHQAGAYHSDLRSANILVEQTGNGLRLHLVDTEAVQFRKTVTELQRLKNLSELNFTFAPGVMITDRLRVLCAYARVLGMNRSTRKTWLRKTIAACERSMNAKVFKPQLRPYRIPSGLPYREQVKTITQILAPRLRKKAGVGAMDDPFDSDT
jgi:tRNA A-37 threonylcarbamoyl transferase component Bud32